jgi:hypothetical protein
MRRIGRLAALVVVVGCVVGMPSIAGAKDPLLAGGGGGYCYEAPPVLDAGWVAIGDNCFSPQMTEVETGQTVRWSLEGQGQHNVTFEDGPYLGSIPADGVAITFRAPGIYAYACSLHPGMTGTVRVSGDPLNGPALEELGTVAPAPMSDVSRAGSTSVLRDSVPMRLEFSPLAAVVLLAIGLPLSLGFAARVVGLGASSVRRPQPRR